MREAIHALRCIFWCLRGTQSTRIDHAVVSRCVFAYWLFRALALQRSVFSENRSKFLTFIARSVGGILCETKEHSRSEMKSNRHTDPTTVTLAAHARRRGLGIYNIENRLARDTYVYCACAIAKEAWYKISHCKNGEAARPVTA